MLAPTLLMLALLAGGREPERLTAIQVHGNTLTSEADVLQLAGLQLGMPVDRQTLEDAAERLRATHKFERVEVLKRFASISDPSQITCVIVLDEGRVAIDWGEQVVEPDGRVIVAPIQKARAFGLMFMPVVDFEDGYGFTYGVRSALPKPAGTGSLLSFPTTWGGEKRAGIEFEKELKTRVLTRVKVEANLTRREHPFMEENDDRRRVWGRAERDVWRSLRVGVLAGWDHVSFLGAHDRFVRAGGDVVFDTRIDPMLARNAVYARAAWDHLAFRNADAANRTEIELRGYIGVFGQSVLVLRGQRHDSNRPLPSYLSPLLGGSANLRGFRAGSDIGDTLVASSAELRLPLTSPLNVGKLGLSAFLDVATVYDKGERLRKRQFDRGFGGGVWLSAAFVRLNLYVAHGVGRSTRVHFGTTVLF